jgi:hypothetical protein
MPRLIAACLSAESHDFNGELIYNIRAPICTPLGLNEQRVEIRAYFCGKVAPDDIERVSVAGRGSNRGFYDSDTLKSITI